MSFDKQRGIEGSRLAGDSRLGEFCKAAVPQGASRRRRVVILHSQDTGFHVSAGW